MTKPILKTCLIGHKFHKTIDCPVYPIYSAEDRSMLRSDFPEKIGNPPLRVLLRSNITNLKRLSKYS